jgi:hypothetical protein
MSWASIIKKNNKKVSEVPKELVVEEQGDVLEYNDNLLEYDDEFDKKYSLKMLDIKFEFREYINDLVLPFLDNNKMNIDINKINFYDFIKNNCENYNKIIRDVDKLNDDYENELETNNNDEIFYDKKFSSFNCA